MPKSITLMTTFYFCFYFYLNALILIYLFQYRKKHTDQIMKMQNLVNFTFLLGQVLQHSFCIYLDTTWYSKKYESTSSLGNIRGQTLHSMSLHWIAEQALQLQVLRHTGHFILTSSCVSKYLNSFQNRESKVRV